MKANIEVTRFVNDTKDYHLVTIEVGTSMILGTRYGKVGVAGTIAFREFGKDAVGTASLKREKLAITKKRIKNGYTSLPIDVKVIDFDDIGRVLESIEDELKRRVNSNFALQFAREKFNFTDALLTESAETLSPPVKDPVITPSKAYGDSVWGTW